MKRHATFLSLLSLVWIAGCVGDAEPEGSPEAAALQQALELDDGGFDATDAEPLFGEERSFAEAGLDTEDPEVTDPAFLFGPEGALAPDADQARAINVLILWGQLRLDRETPGPRRWDGELQVTAGGLLLRRAIRFEGPTDAVLPRTDRQTIAFTSSTRPHHDGLLVSVVPPRLLADGSLPPEGEPQLVIRLAGLEDLVIPAADLIDGFRAAIPVDEEGNVVVITTAPVHPCPQGLLAGSWRHLRDDLGTFQGRWLGEGGELHGHLQGIWGINRAGRRLFFGKYIGNDGAFRGLLRGVWGEGGFTGGFVDREGEYIGGLSGRFAGLDSSLPGDGIFGGLWVEACEAERCGPEGECPGLDPAIPGADELP